MVQNGKKKKKCRIQKIIQLLENNEEDEQSLIPHIIEIEQIFFECFNNENKKNRRIINTYVIPYVNLLLDRVDKGDAKINFPFKEKLLTRTLTFLSSVLRINRNYAHLVVSYFVNLIEQKYYVVKIVEHLKKIIIPLLKGLIFWKGYLHDCADTSIYDNDEEREEEKKNELNNIKQGFHNYAILKSKIFNILTNFHFDKGITENPYKYELIKNLMLILTKEILFFFHILKNKKNIFKEILCEQKKVHHVINQVFDIAYLDVVTDKVNMNSYDEIIMIWLEQDIQLLNDLILFNLSKSGNNINDISKNELSLQKVKEELGGKSSRDGSIQAVAKKRGRKKKLKSEQNVKTECIIKREDDGEETAIKEEHNSWDEEVPKLEIFNKLIAQFNGGYTPHGGKNENADDGKYVTCENAHESVFENMYEWAYQYGVEGAQGTCPSDTLPEEEAIEDFHQLAKKYIISTDCLICTIDEITTDNIVFLTHLMRNVFYLIREVPFVFNFFLKNIFIMVSELMQIQGSAAKGEKRIDGCEEDAFTEDDQIAASHDETGLSSYKKKLFNCMIQYIKNELYLLICTSSVNFPFFYAYVTSLLNLLGEKGSTEELVRKKKASIKSTLLEDEKEKKRKMHENNLNYNCEYLKTNVLRKDFYGYKKLKNEQVDIMSYLKVKMDESENEQENVSENKRDDFIKKEEKENIFINQIVKKLYLTNFKLDKEYYERFDCSRRSNVKDLFCQRRKGPNKSTTDLCDFYAYDPDVSQKDEMYIDNNVLRNTETVCEAKPSIDENSVGQNVSNDAGAGAGAGADADAYAGEISNGGNANHIMPHSADTNIVSNGNEKNTQAHILGRNYKGMYANFLKDDLKYYNNVKSNDSILGTLELYYFLIFSQILNNNLENNVPVLGENIFIKRINNLKVINNVIKRIILNDMMKEKLKFYFLILYLVKINTVCIFKGKDPSDIFLNYSAIFKIFNNLLFFSYIQDEKKKKKKKQIKEADQHKRRADSAYQTHDHRHCDHTLGYTTFCYNYLDKLKNKIKTKGYAYRQELQKSKFKSKCKYDEILNIMIFFLHNDKLLANHRDQYIKTFIEQILETPKLTFSFFIYLIIWLNNIDVHIDYTGYINNSNSGHISLTEGGVNKGEIMNQVVGEAHGKMGEIPCEGENANMSQTKQFRSNKNEDEHNTVANEGGGYHTSNGCDPHSVISYDGKKVKQDKNYPFDEHTCSVSSDGSVSHFDVELSESDDTENYENEENKMDTFNAEEKNKTMDNSQSDDSHKSFISHESESLQNGDTIVGVLPRGNLANVSICTKEMNQENNTGEANIYNDIISSGEEMQKQSGAYKIATTKNSHKKKEKNDDACVITNKENEVNEHIFNINYYIKYSPKVQSASNYYIFCFSLISNLLKKNQNIRAKKTILAIYINTLFKSSNEIRNLLKKLITAAKGIYNNALSFFVYTKRVYRFYHQVFILFLLYICNMYMPHLKNDIHFFSHFAFYLWPMELINFVHNFLLTNFSFFYNDILCIFVNYQNIPSYEKRMRSLKNYEFVKQKLSEYVKGLDRPDIFQSVESFLKQTNFFNTGKANDQGDTAPSAGYSEGAQLPMEDENNSDDSKNEGDYKHGEDTDEEAQECLQKNEISQKILLEEIFVRLFMQAVDLLEDNKMVTKMKKGNVFLNFVSIHYVNSLCNFVITKVEKVYQKNREQFWANFSTLLNESPEEEKKKMTDQEETTVELRYILHFFLNAIDNFLSICIRSSIFFHLYLNTYANCVKKEVRTILLTKFVASLPLLKSLFHEEFFRILKYNNNKWNNQNVQKGKEDEEKKQEDGADSETNVMRNSVEEAEQGKDMEKEKKNEQKNDGTKGEERDDNIENSSFQVNIEIIKYISRNLSEYTSASSVPSWENRTNFFNFCYNLYLENNNIYFIIELVAFLKKEQTVHIFNEIIKSDLEENTKVDLLKFCINKIVKLPYFYIAEKQNENENESYYITNIEIFYFYYNLNKNKNIQKIMLDYFVTKVNLHTVDDQENKMFNDITIKDLANIIQQIAENSNAIFPIYGRFLCQISKNINILREFISSIIIPLLIQKKIWNNKVIWKGCLMCISMLWPDFKHSLFYVFFMLPADECATLFNALQQKYPLASDLIELISPNDQAKRMCPEHLKNLLNS
ncbi:conserved Plasmodium protein, unknown function [Plasmodium knowlesi strain H]|uniref:Symplekin C-terminal domain-containing protein n=3 Tax=Plasmodium knowlesi TaxID=5850 RepID=A0A5K1VQS8_PLAKH|nr:conserved Plasmodium protein, unknown function [Plasmodium knowlesi strain H]OTN64040.1 Uncharacterized protein PKNOH_S140255900 [Plasmodium knowlesi]CAA9990974.1 conserved Plasmodium protein, unknown function [Plasmodium knowlesi strain H]SBO21225.1 conserved Plasmodium protein, unknown function [Plasmodium knowlesi strain H]VVS80448.1 conserved Plasmodium protein, unknown function [Plasmodium knowlesi strain H]|eukprot:XP_002262257.1 hypothetical protein, conserved in Plasmodium species [Plasmodium knowlesi strain H]